MKKNNTTFSNFEGVGVLEHDPVLYENNPNKTFYTSSIKINRMSGVSDCISIYIPNRLINEEIVAGKTVKIVGDIRNHVTYDDNNTRHFHVFVYVKNIELVDNETEHMNYCHMQAIICKNTGCRKTPKGKTIADITVAVNHNEKYSSYLPIIAWNQDAYTITENSKIGDKVKIEGRLQSREYVKNNFTCITYEISASAINLIDNNDENSISN